MILAIDTSTRNASLAVHDSAAVRAEYTWETFDHHTVELMPRIVDVLAAIGVSIDQLSGLAVAIGPGSYTGVRVGVALAKGLALARDLPLVGVRSTDVQAYAQSMHDLPLIAVVRAGRGRLIAACYDWNEDHWQQQGDFELTTIDQLTQTWKCEAILCGELTAAERETASQRLGDRVRLISPALSLRRAGYLAELGWRRIQLGQRDDPARLQPIYVAAKAIEGAG